jgi:hypothetical protein
MGGFWGTAGLIAIVVIIVFIILIAADVVHIS